MRELARRLSITDPSITEDPMSAIRIAFKDALTPDDLEGLFAGKRVPLKWLPVDVYRTTSGVCLKGGSRGRCVCSPTAAGHLHAHVTSPLCAPQQCRSALHPHPVLVHLWPTIPTIYIHPSDAAALGVAPGEHRGGGAVTDKVVVWEPSEPHHEPRRPENRWWAKF
eukprot:TRINITY_DN26945_c0_g1_i1.p1 TRINITY_DN26945_c0_g1~~TRINITY_DN26945_c0_g1_i1.p1  ORF type:complete len:166 (-),score=17.91 TRINITY_DN26945_c0_g1_i1:84-581(-)